MLGAYQKEPFTRHSAALYVAVRGGHHQHVRSLCSLGADVNDIGGMDSGSPLLVAVARKDLKCAQILLDRGANVDAAASFPWAPSLKLKGQNISALMAAALIRHAKMMELLKNNAWTNDVMRGRQYIPALNMAIKLNQLEAASLLLKYGADPNLIGTWYASPPYVLAIEAIGPEGGRNADMLNLLVAYGADPNSRRWEHPPVIRFAMLQFNIAEENERNIFVQVLNHGVNVNGLLPHDAYYSRWPGDTQPPKVKLGWSALHHLLGAESGMHQFWTQDGVCNQSMVGMLLDSGADPLAGFQVPLGPEDVMGTPLGHFLKTAVEVLSSQGLGGLDSIEPAIASMLCFLSHLRGAESTTYFPVDFMARLLGIVALIAEDCCMWFAPTQEKRIECFAILTCVGEREQSLGWGAWLVTLLRSPAYWSLCGKPPIESDPEILYWLRTGARGISSEHWREQEQDGEDPAR